MTPDDKPDGDLEDGPDTMGPYRLLDARFWAALVFLVLCLTAALVVAFQGPKLWPRHAPPAATPSSPTSKHLPLRPDPR